MLAGIKTRIKDEMYGHLLQREPAATWCSRFVLVKRRKYNAIFMQLRQFFQLGRNAPFIRRYFP